MPITPEGQPNSSSSDEQNNPSDIDYLVELIKDQHDRGLSVFEFELKLQRLGLLSPLEDVGILPAVQCLNPFDPELEEDLNNQWWVEHPVEQQNFINAIEKREKNPALLALRLPNCRKRRI